jgi:hypothetical protein
MRLLVFSFFNYYSEFENVADTILVFSFKNHSNYPDNRVSDTHLIVNYEKKDYAYLNHIDYVFCVYFNICTYNVKRKTLNK